MTDKIILQEAINRYGEDSQIDMAIEEMSELTKALLKLRRIKNSDHSDIEFYNSKYIDATTDVEEETADVLVMMDQLKIMFSDRYIETVKAQKINRLKERLGL